MEDIVTYLLYRHDITMKEKEFNEVDALVLSLLAYITWEEIGINKETVVPLTLACQKYQDYFKEQGNKDTYIFSQRILEVLDKVKDARRYRDIILSRYVILDDCDNITQFAAMTFELEENTKFVAYRGTDRTILGWKENVKLLYSPAIHGHVLASEYLKEVPKSKGLFKKTKLYLGGHSKGAHLAMVAAIMDSDDHHYIQKVFSFDGPGFLPEFYHDKDLASILPKITNYVPECSVIGRMLEHKEKIKVIASYAPGLRQHDATSWKCKVDSFEYLSSFSVESEELLVSFHQLVLTKDSETRKRLMDSLSLWLDTMEMKTLSDMKSLNINKGIQGLVGFTNLQSDERKFMFELAGMLVEQAADILMIKNNTNK